MIANVPVKPEANGSNTLMIFRYPTSGMIELVTVAVSATTLTVTGLPVITGVPQDQPVGTVGRVGSVTVQVTATPPSYKWIAPLVQVSPACRRTSSLVVAASVQT